MQQTVSDQLKKLITTLEPSLNQVSRTTGVSVSTLSRWVKGDASPTIATIDKIISAYGLHLSVITSPADPLRQAVASEGQHPDTTLSLDEVLKLYGVDETQWHNDVDSGAMPSPEPNGRWDIAKLIVRKNAPLNRAQNIAFFYRFYGQWATHTAWRDRTVPYLVQLGFSYEQAYTLAELRTVKMTKQQFAEVRHVIEARNRFINSILRGKPVMDTLTEENLAHHAANQAGKQNPVDIFVSLNTERIRRGWDEITPRADDDGYWSDDPNTFLQVISRAGTFNPITFETIVTEENHG